MKTLTLNPVDGLTITFQVEIIPAQKGGLETEPMEEQVVVDGWEINNRLLAWEWYERKRTPDHRDFYDFIHRLCCEEIERQRELSNEP